MGPLCLILGLLSGESGLAVGAYLFSYTLFLDNGTFLRRFFAILPYGVIAGIWFYAYNRMGFGTFGSGMYIEPGQETLQFLIALLRRIPILIMGQFAMPPAFFYIALPQPWHNIIWGWALFLLAMLVIVLYPLVKHNVTARFWALGMALSLIPICSTYPDNRLLFFVGIGAMGLLAQLITGLYENSEWLFSGKSWRVLTLALANFLFFIHLILAPILLPVATRFDKFFEPMVDRPANSLALRPDNPEQQVVLVNPPGAFFVYYTLIIRHVIGLPTSTFTRVLTTGDVPVKITSIDECTLEVHPEGGFMTAYQSYVVRGPAHPMGAGQRVELTGMVAEILSVTKDHRPQKVRYSFLKPLNDTSLKFLKWNGKEYERFWPPVIGESISLSANKGAFF